MNNTLRTFVRKLPFHWGDWFLAFSLSFGGHPCATQMSLAATMLAAYEALNALISFPEFRKVEILRSLFQSSNQTKNAFQYHRSAFSSCWKLSSLRICCDASKLC